MKVKSTQQKNNHNYDYGGNFQQSKGDCLSYFKVVLTEKIKTLFLNLTKNIAYRLPSQDESKLRKILLKDHYFI